MTLLADSAGKLSSLNQLVEYYYLSLTALLDKHAPLITKTIVTKPKVPRYSDMVRRLHFAKRRLEKHWSKSREKADWEICKHVRNIYRQQLQLEEATCCNNAVIKCGNDTNTTIMQLLSVVMIQILQ